MSKAPQLSQSHSSPRVFADVAAIAAARGEVGRVLELTAGARYEIGAADLGSGILMANTLYANLINSDTSLVVSLISFGATASPGTDDTTAITAAFNSGATQLDGQGLTYRIDSTIACTSSIRLKNATFNFANAAASDTLCTIHGSVSSSITPSSIAKGSQVVTVPDGSVFSIGEKITLQSADIFSTAESSTVGEWAVIKEISGNALTLTAKTLYAYTTTPVVKKYSLLEVKIDDVKILSVESLEHRGFDFLYCDSPQVSSLNSVGFGDRANAIGYSYAPVFDKCEYLIAKTPTGLAYGIVAGPMVDYGKYLNGHAEDVRHAVTIGALGGTCNHSLISGWTSKGCTDSALDCHPNTNYTKFTGNVLGHQTTVAGGSGDGITAQGANVSVSDNLIYGCSRASILIQPLSDFVDEVISMSSNQIVDSERASGAVVSVTNQKPAGSIKSILIDGLNINTTSASSGAIIIESQADGVDIDNIVVSNICTSSTGKSLHVLVRTGRIIKNIVVGNFVGVTTSVDQNFMFNSVDSNGIVDVVLNGFISEGGVTAVRHINATNAILTGGRIKGWSGAATSGTFTTAGLITTA